MKNKSTSDHCQSSGKTTATVKTATDLDLPNTTTKLYLNESLCPYYHILGQKKHYLQWVKLVVISFQMYQLKYVFKKRDLQFQLQIQLILKIISLVWTWMLQDRFDLYFYSFFTVVFLMVWLCQCLVCFHFYSSEYASWLSARICHALLISYLEIFDASNPPRLVDLLTYYFLSHLPF